MKQYNAIKAKHPDALLLFRVGDFYETFNEDAVRTARILGIVLTKRSNGASSETELAGFPHHALDTYLPKLVRAGERVAICDQLEDPKTAKTVVKRGVTELVTPGVAFSDKILDHRENNFLAVVYAEQLQYGAAFVDVSTGEFLITQGDESRISRLLQNFRPSEIVFPREAREELEKVFGSGRHAYRLDEWVFTYDFGCDTLLRHFKVQTLKGFGIEDLGLGIIAGGAALHYVEQLQQGGLRHITRVSRIDDDAHVWLDKFTVRNLELVAPVHENARTLIDVLDRTISPMGARKLRRWLLMPLRDRASVEARHAVVAHFLEDSASADGLAAGIADVGDLERIVSRASVGKIGPRELNQLKKALDAVGRLKSHCGQAQVLHAFGGALDPCNTLHDLIGRTLKEEPNANLLKGGVIADGYSDELDELRQLAFAGKDHLLKIQERESERTGIPSMKIGFNNVFGYYLEVTHTHKEKVPPEWVRKQTLTNAERYITDELKDLEEKILGAEQRIVTLEEKLYRELVAAISDYIVPLQANATVVAELDCLHSFAVASRDNGYHRPVMEDNLQLDIRGGRHPVLEQQVPPGEQYVPNDVSLDPGKRQIIIITGPNMSGKSALLRQTALTVIMAQSGCFVPAGAATIGMVDKIFTRVGASDNISSGESTFMVEMNETASILNNLSPASLVILDEIGRGTSTYDGISIAWAIAEFLHENPVARPKTLFATHYHELNEIAASYPRIENFHVAIRESGNKVLFLRTLKPGGSQHSFGIHVARMAGIPPEVTDRADRMLALLEKAHSNSELVRNSRQQEIRDDMQLSFFKLDDPILERIRDEISRTDINALTPVEALMKLNEIKKLIRG